MPARPTPFPLGQYTHQYNTRSLFLSIQTNHSFIPKHVVHKPLNNVFEFAAAQRMVNPARSATVHQYRHSGSRRTGCPLIQTANGGPSSSTSSAASTTTTTPMCHNNNNTNRSQLQNTDFNNRSQCTIMIKANESNNWQQSNDSARSFRQIYSKCEQH